MLTERQVQIVARENDVVVEDICSTCGRLAYEPVAAHFGHPVTRLVTQMRPMPKLPPAPKATGLPPAPPAAPRPSWLTVAEIAGSLGVSKMTVYRLVKTGALVGHRFGRSVRVSRGAVDAYLAQSQVDA